MPVCDRITPQMPVLRLNVTRQWTFKTAPRALRHTVLAPVLPSGSYTHMEIAMTQPQCNSKSTILNVLSGTDTCNESPRKPLARSRLPVPLRNHQRIGAFLLQRCQCRQEKLMFSAAQYSRQCCAAPASGRLAVSASLLNATKGMSAEISGRPDKLVILCIHGFRQNAKQFKGRLAGLQKKLADAATFIFIDAPYVLPLWYKPQAGQPQQQQQQAGQPQQQQQQTLDAGCIHGSNSPHSVDYTGYCRAEQQSSPARPHHRTWQQHGPPDVLPHPKRAWLLSSELLEAPHLQSLYAQGSLQQHMLPSQQQVDSGSPNQKGVTRAQHPMQQIPQQHETSMSNQEAALYCQLWQPAPENVTVLDQHTTQCCGWGRSWNVIHNVLESGQRIDGILGFSQGAAVAAVVAALLQQQQQQEEASWQDTASLELAPNEESGGQLGADPVVQPQLHAPITTLVHPMANHASQQSHTSRPPSAGLKFVILGSGFVSPAEEHRSLLRQVSPIMLPSLHVYAAGDGSSDRQIHQQFSEDLMQLFHPASRQLVVHSAGHLIPCSRNVVDQIKEFLNQFT